jgi:hypothetical protein
MTAENPGGHFSLPTPLIPFVPHPCKTMRHVPHISSPTPAETTSSMAAMETTPKKQYKSIKYKNTIKKSVASRKN